MHLLWSDYTLSSPPFWRTGRRLVSELLPHIQAYGGLAADCHPHRFQCADLRFLPYPRSLPRPQLGCPKLLGSQDPPVFPQFDDLARLFPPAPDDKMVISPSMPCSEATTHNHHHNHPQQQPMLEREVYTVCPRGCTSQPPKQPPVDPPTTSHFVKRKWVRLTQ